jgi:hypothetical protein
MMANETINRQLPRSSPRPDKSAGRARADEEFDNHQSTQNAWRNGHRGRRKIRQSKMPNRAVLVIFVEAGSPALSPQASRRRISILGDGLRYNGITCFKSHLQASINK